MHQHVYDALRALQGRFAQCLDRRACNVRGQHHVGQFGKRMALRQRLLFEDVQARAGDPALAQGRDQRLLLDQPAA